MVGVVNHHDYHWAEASNGLICYEVPTLVRTAIADLQDYSGRERSLQGEEIPRAVASADRVLSAFLYKGVRITGTITHQFIFVEVRF